jgi:hypothetical protein
MQPEIVDLRKGERFVVIEPISGSFGGSEVTITNIGPAGLQIHHPQPLRIGTRARLSFRRGDIVIDTQARVIWSHLSSTAHSSGKLLYNTGIRIEALDQQYATAVNALFRRGYLRQDPDSLERKRQRQIAREQQRNAPPGVSPTKPA